jgi:hypothetical protein
VKVYKIQIDLINNPVKEEKLFLALKNKNKEAKMRFLKSFFKTIPVC